jgi:Mg2+-importing ATPase
VLVIRSRKPFFKSMPGKYLFAATILVALATLILPLSPLAGLFGFQPLPVEFLPLLAAIVVSYIMAAEIAKKVFYSKVKL